MPCRLIVSVMCRRLGAPQVAWRCCLPLSTFYFCSFFTWPVFSVWDPAVEEVNFSDPAGGWVGPELTSASCGVEEVAVSGFRPSPKAASLLERRRFHGRQKPQHASGCAPC